MIQTKKILLSALIVIAFIAITECAIDASFLKRKKERNDSECIENCATNTGNCYRQCFLTGGVLNDLGGSKSDDPNAFLQACPDPNQAVNCVRDINTIQVCPEQGKTIDYVLVKTGSQNPETCSSCLRLDFENSLPTYDGDGCFEITPETIGSSNCFLVKRSSLTFGETTQERCQDISHIEVAYKDVPPSFPKCVQSIDHLPNNDQGLGNCEHCDSFKVEADACVDPTEIYPDCTSGVLSGDKVCFTTSEPFSYIVIKAGSPTSNNCNQSPPGVWTPDFKCQCFPSDKYLYQTPAGVPLSPSSERFNDCYYSTAGLSGDGTALVGSSDYFNPVNEITIEGTTYKQYCFATRANSNQKDFLNPRRNIPCRLISNLQVFPCVDNFENGECKEGFGGTVVKNEPEA